MRRSSRVRGGVAAGGRQFEGQLWLAELKLARERQDTATERDVLRRRYRGFVSANRAHPQSGRVSDDCVICKGSGVNGVPRNLAQHYDSWQIGGRWDGVLGPFGKLGPNLARLEDLRFDPCPAAVVTAEGDWYAGPLILASTAEFREPET